MADLAELIFRHAGGKNDRGRTFDADACTVIGALAEDWGNRMLASGDAARLQLAAIATVASCAPSVSLLRLLKLLLDENLRRYRAFREAAIATGWRRGKATDEARTPHMQEYQRAFHAINEPETATLMREYLHNEYFGQPAAFVLAAQWTAANEPSESEHFQSGVDFSSVEEKRVTRASEPTVTSAEADAIFSAIEPLIADTATKDQNNHAVALGVVAARLPHGQRDAVIQQLISLASRHSRVALLKNLILSGESIDIEMIRNGIAEVLEAAKEESWILTEGAYELKEWLRLLPFAHPPAEAFAVVCCLPDDQRRVDRLEEMIAGFGVAPGDDAENFLFQFAETYPTLYANHVWRDAALRRGTRSAALRFVDLAANGVFDRGEADRWRTARQISGLIGEHPDLRTHIYQLLEHSTAMHGFALLARSVAETPDADGLLLLIKIEKEHKHPFVSLQAIENVVAEHVPSEYCKGAYEVVPVPAVELRRKLIAMTTDGGPSDVAARCLDQVDEIRDEYGIPDSEPRHPDLESGKPWPNIMPAGHIGPTT